MSETTDARSSELREPDEALSALSNTLFRIARVLMPSREIALSVTKEALAAGPDRVAALEAFRRYLAVAPPKDPERPAVQQLADELTRELRPPDPPPAPPKRDGASALRRYWWTIPVGGVALAGTAVGIWYAATWPPCDQGSAGCIDLRR